MRRALVTGAAGFIGSHIVDELLDQGWEVCGLDDLSTGDLENLERAHNSDSFTFVRGDVRDRTTVINAIGEADVIFHQAALASVPDSFEDPQAVTTRNCAGTATVMDGAVDRDVESVVIASSAAVYGSGDPLPKKEGQPVEPESPYAASKYYAEKMARQVGGQAGINVAALRYFNVFGPRQDPEGEYAAVIPKFITLLLNGERPVIFGDGEQSRDFVFVKDVVAANLAVATGSCSGVFNVARGESVTINELVEIINEILDMNLEPMYEDPRSGDIRHSCGDISKARKILDYEPSITFENGIKQTINSLRTSQDG
ncbi:SDR family NAD(P)-dependent oxidoreductase [Halonotius pteroides]|uniref:GDP-mannose 4,6-dehydratase n=1 Tax=Halonotius pteroides TaxID=268735 RepID=A0A3A6Q5V5_9EURY|nr:SDR family NAD(P)-dependent oxidoreductase [Halonotius pteroides]RJX47507.1 GDP-mannose 4,6-dehydratase [Halonotius pteroides]